VRKRQILRNMMDNILLGVCDFPSLCLRKDFFEEHPDADEVLIEFDWEEPDYSVGFVGGYFWNAFVKGQDVTHFMSYKDTKFVDDALRSYDEVYS
jgi:hypothetical protein